MEKGKKNNLIVKKPDKHYLSQVIKVNIISGKWYNENIALYLCDLPPKHL